MATGTLYWITGLAGAGKSSVAKELVKFFNDNGEKVILLDGDEIREVLNSDNKEYDLEHRFVLAMKYSKLCKLITNQGINVICATISMFEKCREWNRNNIPLYVEVYLKVPLDILKKRDQKQLYSKAEKGLINNVLGMDIPFEEPKQPNLIIINNGTLSINDIAKSITNYNITNAD